MTSVPTSEADRIEALEVRIAHQDLVIADLNEVISEQWRRLEALERQLTRLREEVESVGAERGGHEPPPHY